MTTPQVTRGAKRPAPCCEPTSTQPLGRRDSDRYLARVALVGNPNVGKSTLFNALTGARQHVGNWPGKTVHVATGDWRLTEQRTEQRIELVDLPGTYSLLPKSPDEALTRDLLVDRGLDGRPDAVVVVVDASNLARNLYLLAQVLDTGLPVLVALTMGDVAEARGIAVDPQALGRTLGVPVVATAARRRTGSEPLAAALRDLLTTGMPESGAPACLGHDIEPIVDDLVTLISANAEVSARLTPRWLAVELLTDGPGVEHLDGYAGAEAILAAVPAAQRRLLALVEPADEPDSADLTSADLTSADLTSADLTSEDPTSEDPTGADPSAGLTGADQNSTDPAEDLETLVAERRYAWVHEVVAASVRRSGERRVNWSDRFDRVLTSRWFGIPVFLLVMWAVFEATTRVASPLQRGLQAVLDGPVHHGAATAIGWLGMSPSGWAGRLILDGLVSGVGQLLTFVPLMTIMFVLLTVLEDSGYMARAAFVVDRLMRLIGLPGQAFLPLIVGFGCNVPAIAGTRILSDARHRLLTSLLVPYVTCSARLTVYVLLANVFFGSSAGSVVFAMYLVSIMMIVLIGLALRATLFRGQTRQPLVLELPPYRRPTLRVIATETWQRLAGFLRTAGGIIVLTVTAVWLLTSLPAGTSMQDSYFGKASHAVAPVFVPAGYGDWHASAALLTGFVAKEAVISTFAQTYSATEPADAHSPGELSAALTDSFDRSSGGKPVPAVLAFMVFLLAYTPCMATVAAQRHEIGTKWTMIGMGIQLAIAWALSVAIFQIGSLLW